MNTKKAIEFLEIEKEMSYNDRTRKYAREIVILLQRGEKYEAIVEELENCLLPEEYKTVEKLLREYFPKEIKEGD